MEMSLKLARYGNGFAFAVPKALVDCKILEKGKSYKIIVEDSEDNNGSIVYPGYPFNFLMGART